MTARSDELAFLSLTDSARLIRRGELSPVELTEALLARIEDLEPALNAFVTITPDSALAEARAAAEALAGSGDPDDSGALHGVPVAIKDLFDVRGQPTTAGSPILADNVAGDDAFVVARLRAAGAVFLGKTLTHEFAFGTTTINPHFGATRNPWDRERIAGGSSGGNGAGLAAGMFAGCLGSDTGGSIRIPAAHCGVVGLKPTRGRLSLSGVQPLSWTLDHAGPMARSVRDVALLLSVTEGFDPRDPVSTSVPDGRDLGALDGGLDGLRVGVPVDYFWDNLEPEVERAARAAIALLQELGAQLVDLPAMGWREAFRANGHMLLPDAAAAHEDLLREHADRYGPDIVTRLQRGQSTLGPVYANARRDQAHWRRKLALLFDDVDLVATPATPEVARPIEGAEGVATARVLTSLTAPFNLTGLPAISVPCAFTSDGLPVGLQLVATWWGEARLLRAAHAYETATDWHTRRPSFDGGAPTHAS